MNDAIKEMYDKNTKSNKSKKSSKTLNRKNEIYADIMENATSLFRANVLSSGDIDWCKKWKDK